MLSRQFSRVPSSAEIFDQVLLGCLHRVLIMCIFGAVSREARACGGLGPDGEVPGALHIQVPQGGAGGPLLPSHGATAQHSGE